jgi:ornithine carbamoyltransferase
MGRSLLACGALMGSDVRIVTPADLRPPDDVSVSAQRIAGVPDHPIEFDVDYPDREPDRLTKARATRS